MNIVKSTGKYLLLLAILAVVGPVGCEIAALVDSTAPTVSSTVPVDSATGVAINSNVTATFSEAMAPATITSATFTLKLGTTAVAGTVTYTGTVAIFNPTSDLNQGALYTATITTGAKDLAGNGLAANEAWSFTTADTAVPSVVSTDPADTDVDVPIAGNITAIFSEAMAEATVIAAGTFTLMQGETPVTGTVTYTGTTATFDPTAALAYGTVYEATISVDATDLVGNPLEAAKVWSFTTATAPDETLPTVVPTAPANSAVDVVITTNITATFSEAMDEATINDATFLLEGASAVAGLVTYSGVIATFNPTADLSYSTVYTATITTGAKDPSGNALAAPMVWSFTTEDAPDTTAPTVDSTVPVDLATDVSVTDNITATFSEAMNDTTINDATFLLEAPGPTPVAGLVTYSGVVATFDPTDALENDTLYTATITTGVTDLAGLTMTANKVWTFTTVAAIPLGPAPVNLGTAGNYVILAKTAVSTTGATAITGDIGVSPVTSTALTGFSQVTDAGGTFSTSSLVTGKLYAVDYAAPTPAQLTTAVEDMVTAYNDAAGRSADAIIDLLGGTLANQTLAPGLYTWGSSVNITTNLTLEGAANDVWIFKITNDLDLANAMQIVLSGGALPKNIFWQVAGTVTIGTTAHFEGIILCATQISLLTGATMNGRALAQTAVVLDANTLVKPAE